MNRPASQERAELKTIAEIRLMRESGKLVFDALQICRRMAQPGVKTIEIDRAVEAYFASKGAVPLFKGYNPGDQPYPACTCLSVNEQVVHGIPGGRVLQEGDLLKVDTACRLNGWCADSAVTLPIGEVRAERLRLLKVAQETLQIAITELPRRRWWSEIGAKMQKHVQNAGFSVVEQYVGHGIGRTMHELPQVPNFTSREMKTKHDFRLVPGLVIAVEPMVNMGRVDVDTLGDHWTVVTRDGLPSVHVEHTLALTEKGVVVITADSSIDVFA